MIEKVRAQREVAGSNPVGHVVVKFTRKMPEMDGRWPVGPPSIKKFSIFFLFFSGFFSVSTLPSVGHSAKNYLPTGFLPEALCRGQSSLCRVH